MITEFTIGERTAVVGADIVEGVPAVIDVEHRDHLPLHLDEGLTRIRHLVDGDHPLKLMHFHPSGHVCSSLHSRLLALV